MDNNPFLESMDEAMTARWEAMLEITKADNDTFAGQEISASNPEYWREGHIQKKAIGERLKLLCLDGFQCP